MSKQIRDKAKLLNEIVDLTAFFSKKIEILSKQNENSINVLAESIFARVLNAIFGCELVNANYSRKTNNPAIDLIDPKKRIAFQVSANSTNQKIYDTLQKFTLHGLYESIDTLYFLFTTRKGKLTKSEKIAGIIREL